MKFSVRVPGLSHFPPLTHDWQRTLKSADILTMLHALTAMAFVAGATSRLVGTRRPP